MDSVSRTQSGNPMSDKSTAPAAWVPPAAAHSIPVDGPDSELLRRKQSDEVDDGKIHACDEDDWVRVSLSSTPPFDALNYPSPAFQRPSGGAKPRAFWGDTLGSVESAQMDPIMGDQAQGDSNEIGVKAGRMVMGPWPGDKAGWTNFLASPHRMAPTGDAYMADSPRSGRASASATTRTSSDSSFLARGSGGTAETSRSRQSTGWPPVCSYSSVNSASLEALQSPPLEAYGQKGRHASSNEVGQNYSERAKWPSPPYTSGRGGHIPRWNEAAEISREYTRRWRNFLIHAGTYFTREVGKNVHLTLFPSSGGHS